MSLDLALNNALSGLSVNQESLAVLSNNIANANTDGYARRVVNQVSITLGGVGAGARVESVTRQIDQFLVASVREQGTSLSEATIVDEFHTRIQTLFGQPSTGGSLSAAVDNFFSSLTSLSVNPELSSLRLNTVNDATNLISKLGGLAQSLEELRFEADRDINSTLGFINQQLRELNELNPAIRTAQNSGIPDAPLVERREILLQNLAENIDLSLFITGSGEVSITTGTGISLLEDDLKQLIYTPAASANTFIDDVPLDSIKIQTFRQNGEKIGQDEIIVSAGVESDITKQVEGGKLNGLLRLRDEIIPNLLGQLDNLATALADQVNAIHNDGAGFPPPTTLTGTTTVIPGEEHLFSGSVRIGLVNPDGTPVSSAYSDDPLLRPFTLDLSSLDNGQGNGRPDIQTIVDEINDYFGPPPQTLTLGPLADIRIASRTNTIGPQAGFPTDSIFTFDFELDNAFSNDIDFEVLDVQVLNAGATGLVGTLPGTYTLEGGERTRTGAANSITVDFNGVATAGPYTIRSTVRAIDANGVSFLTTVDYEVSDNITNAFNDRTSATSVFSGDGETITPNTSQRYATAEFVDSNGNPAASGGAGFLQITTNTNGRDYRIAIDELDSLELGQPENSVAVPASNRGFSHFFGLNNFFVETETPSISNGAVNTVDGAAVNLAVRSDILSDPNRISLGELTQSTITQTIEKQVTVGTVQAVGTIQFAANTAVGDTLDINGSIFTFVAGVPVLDSEIQVGGTLPQTLINIATELNANNTFTQGNAALATYSFNGVDSITATYDSPGLEGNAFSLATNLGASAQNATINGGTPSQTASDVLQGGVDGIATLTSNELYTYELSVGGNQVITRLSELGLTNVAFSASGGLPASAFSFSRYGAEIIGFTSTLAVNASAIREQALALQEGFTSRLEAGSGVNVDEELANTILFQNAYQASAQVIRVTGELFDVLFQSF